MPLLDHLVVEAVLALPDRVRFLPLGKKALLRRLAMPRLDHSIFNRPKAGFVLPLELWAKRRLRSEIDAIFSEHQLLQSVGLSPGAVARLWRSFQAGAPGIHWSRIWAPFVLLRWCQNNRVGLR